MNNKKWIIAIASALDAGGVIAGIIMAILGGGECPHEFGSWVIKVAPSCTDEGSEERACGKCGEVETRAVASLGHDPAEAVRENEKAASCTEEGSYDEVVKCSRCQFEMSRVSQTIEKTDHVASDWIIDKDSTCSEAGEKHTECTVCKTELESGSVELKAHTEITVEGKAPTCNASGLTEGKKCSVCGAVTVEQTVIDPIPHTETVIAGKAPTCTEEGLTEGEKCSVCGAITEKQSTIPATSHTEVVIEGKAPTCTENGLTEGKKCSVCGVVTKAQQPVAATGHVYDDKNDASCNVCGNVRDTQCAHTNVVTIIGTAATCTESGLTDGKKCAECGEIIEVQQTIAAFGHVEITISGKAATCTENGLTDGKKCSTCGAVTVAQTTIIATGHVEITISGKAPTCTENGLTDGKKCSTCGTVTVAQTTIIATGHVEITISGKAPTCTENGLTDGKKCSTCGTVTVAQTTIVATGHVEITISGKAATCTENGLTDGKKCSTCGTVTVAQTTIIATGHVEITISGKSATCTENGLTDGKKCSTCGTVTVAQTTTIATGHNSDGVKEENRVNSTCAVAGSYEKVVFCTACSYEQSRTKIDLPLSTNHTSGAWVTDKNASCTEAGSKHLPCTVCGTVLETQELPILPHAFGQWVTTQVATCESDGAAKRECANCPAFETDTLTKLGHQWSDNYYANEGEHWKVCTRSECGTKSTTAVHNGGEATCTKLAECAICGSEYGSLLDHDYIKCIIEDAYIAKEATCTESPEYYYACTMCEAAGSETYKFGGGLGHTGGEATCTEKAVCTRCFNEYGDVLGHEFVEGVCTRCGMGHVSEGLKFTLSGDGTYYIVSGIGDCTDRIISIPETHEGLPVKEIGYGAFEYENITRIIIPEGVIRISDYAFYYCRSLASVSLPSTLTEIGSYAFYTCESLKSIVIPDRLVTMAYNAFGGCVNLESITLPFIGTTSGSRTYTNFSSLFGASSSYNTANYMPRKLKTVIVTNTDVIPANAFEKCALTKIVLPDGLKTIESGAFRYCSSLTDIYLPSGLLEIGGYAFEGCSSLEILSIPDSVVSIDSNAFKDCSSLKDITIPDGIQSIGSGVFSNCTSLVYTEYDGNKYLGNANSPYLVLVEVGDSSIVKYTIPDTVRVVLDTAFTAHKKLLSITVSENVVYISNNTFINCKTLYEVYNLSELTITIGSTDNGYVAYYAKNLHTSMSEPSIVSELDGFIFVDLDGVCYVVDYVGDKTDLVFPESFNGNRYNIYDEAFCDRTDITSITLSNGVHTVGEYAFARCKSIRSITVGDEVASIGLGAFEQCTSLESLTIPFIGANADGTGNAYIGHIFGVTNTYYYSSPCPSSLKTITLTKGTELIDQAFYMCTSVESIYLPDTIVSIGYRAFGECKSLKTISIPSGVTSIGSGAFYLCTSLEELKLPEVIGAIPSDMFYGCAALKKVDIPNGVASIGSNAFSGCSSLESIAIPGGVTEIGTYAFNGCSALKEITIPSGVANIAEGTFTNCQALKTVNLPASVTEIGKSAFMSCTALESIDLTNVKTIGNSAFYECNSLKSINSSSLEMLDLYAFRNCTGLERIEISSVIGIGEYAFAGCTSLEYVDLGSALETIDTYAFYGCTALKTVYVPETVNFVGAMAFGGCSSLVYNEHDNASYIGSKTSPYIIFVKHNDKTVTSCDIPDSARVICDGVFENCSSLQKVTGGNGLVYIGNKAFYYCRNLTEFSFGNKLERLGGSAFYGAGLKTVVLPDSLEVIGGSAFGYCSSLTSLTIGSGLKTIPTYAFSGCSALTSVDLGQVETIERSAFQSCTALTSVTIPISVKSINGEAFYACEKLTSAVFQDVDGWYYEQRKSWGSSVWWEKQTLSPSSIMSRPGSAVYYIKDFGYVIYNS